MVVKVQRENVDHKDIDLGDQDEPALKQTITLTFLDKKPSDTPKKLKRSVQFEPNFANT